MKTRKPNTAGFTLLEMVGVVLIMASVAGSMLMSFGGGENSIQQNTLNGLAHHEMAQIKKALLQFRNDTGNFPSITNPVDFSLLFDTTDLWNIDTNRGRRGPYLNNDGEGYTDIGNNIQSDGSGDPAVGAAINDVESIADPFLQFPVAAGSYLRCGENATNSNCLLDWRIRAADYDEDGDVDAADNFDPDLYAMPRQGRPYMLFDLNNQSAARVVSMGPNGRYESTTTTDCKQNSPTGGDDLILCLR
ncbi:MAG: type II secretion system GspH family protein [Pseudomonadales bacterium]|nr:type II secretion system GspH family protein [Pseudomonadales bacterium]